MIAPDDLKYTEDHEWLRLEGEIATVGITDHAQAELSDVVFVELPDLGKELDAGDPAAVVESVKAASDIYAPVAGEVVAINEDLIHDPAKINGEPYGTGWIFKIKVSDPASLDGLMDAAAYGGLVG
ncbi:MAG: glycine cleavage system protein GcvH [Verrucomicrobiales bacterium]